MQSFKRLKAIATYSCLHSKTTFTKESQSKNKEQFVVFVLTEKNLRRSTVIRQAYFLLQLCINAISQYSKPAKTMVEPPVPRVKAILTLPSKNHPPTLQYQCVIFHEALWTWCFTKNLTYWHFPEKAWECRLSSGRANFDGHSRMQHCWPTTLYDICHFSVKPSLQQTRLALKAATNGPRQALKNAEIWNKIYVQGECIFIKSLSLSHSSLSVSAWTGHHTGA